MMSRQWLRICGVLVAVWACKGQTVQAVDKTDQRPAVTERNWQVGFTPSYSSGNFGTNTTSDFFYGPLSIRRYFRDGDVSLVIPFVALTTDGRATLVDGKPIRVEDNSGNSGSGGNGSGSSDDCPGNSGSNSGQGGGRKSCLTGRAEGQTVTTVGLGDIILRGRYYVLEEKKYLPLVALTARMKFPTANSSQGLGTGAFDHGYGVEVSKLIGEKWLAFLDGGYNFIGDPDGLELQNQYWYDIGTGYYLTKDLLASVYFEEYRTIVPGLVNIRDFFFGLNYRASAAWRFNGGVAVGVSNGAPDYIFSVGSSYRF
jgi:hypothetical protein